MMFQKKNAGIAIVGTVGVPANYGGFETLVENLVKYHHYKNINRPLTVYCSAKAYCKRPATYMQADLKYIPLHANGVQSIPFDIWSLFSAIRNQNSGILILGVSGCICLPLLRRMSSARIITNIDGIEWRRDKWGSFTKWFLKFSEKLAVRHSDVVIVDNQAIADYVVEEYGKDCVVIAYGGDHALAALGDSSSFSQLPDDYALALCRIEPENNIAMILDAWTRLDRPLVFVGNWNKSGYGRTLRRKYADIDHIHLLDPVYNASALRAIRDGAGLYVHGHSAGGTNPSLVEMMHFGIPVVAHGCSFNRFSTEDSAHYFLSADALVQVVSELDSAQGAQIGSAMKTIAEARYTWAQVGQQYLELF
jgi:glycosyltransferase involved in cell wall biosynthesis